MSRKLSTNSTNKENATEPRRLSARLQQQKENAAPKTARTAFSLVPQATTTTTTQVVVKPSFSAIEQYKKASTSSKVEIFCDKATQTEQEDYVASTSTSTSTSSTLKVQRKSILKKSSKAPASNTGFSLLGNAAHQKQNILCFSSPGGSNRRYFTVPISPIESSVNEVLSNVPLVPAQKRTLSRRKIYKKVKSDREQVHYFPIASDVYIKEYYESLRNYNWMYIMDHTFLNNFKVNLHTRNSSINYIININENIGERTCVLLNTVKILDTVLASMYVPKEMYDLIATAAFWICIKLDNTAHIDVDRFLKYSSKYTKKQYLDMERKILKFLDFNLTFIDPTIYISLIIERFKNVIEAPEFYEEVELCTSYILELFTLDTQCSAQNPLILACAAMNTTLDLIVTDKEEHTFYCKLVGKVANKKERDEISAKWYIVNKMKILLEQVTHESYPHRDIFIKYSCKEYKSVANMLIQK